MANVDLMRAEIAKEYPGHSWKLRVSNMHPNQVIAIYYAFKRKHEKQLAQEKEHGEQLAITLPVDPNNDTSRQMTIWDILNYQ